MKYILVLKRSKKGWYWKLVHQNTKILGHAEGYSGKNKAEKTVRNLYNSFKLGHCKIVYE